MGGEKPRAAPQIVRAPIAHLTLSPSSPRPLSSRPRHFVIPATSSVIPAQAGTRARTHARHPFPNSSLPPARGEVRRRIRQGDWRLDTEHPSLLVRSGCTT